MSHEMHESTERLWIPILAPSIWAIHFTVCYATVVGACGRFGRADAPSLLALLGVYTIAAMAAIGALFVHGWRRHRSRWPRETHDDDTPEDRRHFMAWTTMLLAGLSLVATVMVALAAFLVGGCG
jgi:ABC-type Fe3+ transport system permease subunit